MHAHVLTKLVDFWWPTTVQVSRRATPISSHKRVIRRHETMTSRHRPPMWRHSTTIWRHRYVSVKVVCLFIRTYAGGYFYAKHLCTSMQWNHIHVCMCVSMYTYMPAVASFRAEGSKKQATRRQQPWLICFSTRVHVCIQNLMRAYYVHTYNIYTYTRIHIRIRTMYASTFICTYTQRHPKARCVERFETSQGLVISLHRCLVVAYVTRRHNHLYEPTRDK